MADKVNWLSGSKPEDKKAEIKKEDKPSAEPIFHHDHAAKSNWLLHPIKSFKKFYWRNFEKETLVLINMQLSNGKYISFIRPISENKFSIFGNTYIVDVKMLRYSLSAGMNFLRYHQEYASPVDPDIDANALKTAVESSGIIDCPAATNPSNITRFLNSNIIEQIFQGAALGQMLMIIMILGIVTLVGVIVSIITIFMKIGALEKLIGK